MHERIRLLWLVVPMLIYGAGLAALALHIRRHSAAAFWLAALGLLLYMSVPLQEHVEGFFRHAATVQQPWIRPAWARVLEEGAELFATLGFIAAFGLYALAQGRDPTMMGRSQRTSVWLPQRNVRAGMIAAFAMLTAAAAFFEFVVPESWTGPHRLRPCSGIASNWFAAASALLAALVSVQAWRTERGRRAEARRLNVAWILLATSVCCLLLSAAHGADLLFADKLWPRSPRAQFAVRLAAALTAASLGTVLFLRGRAAEVRIGFLVWPALVGIALLADPVGASLLLVLGYGSLVLGLQPHLIVPPPRSRGMGLTQLTAPAPAMPKSTESGTE